MIIGVPKEIKNNENRVAITPAGVHELVKSGHKLLIERSAGNGSGIEDVDYTSAGASILEKSTEVYQKSDLIFKVKEPLESEYNLLKEGQILFTYLHLAPNKPLTEALLRRRITGIAFETVHSRQGTLPLLTPMSEVAGRMSVQIGANLLQKYNGGKGILLGGVPGVAPAEVLIIGGGVVGLNAAKIAIGMGARVTVMDVSGERLAQLDDIFGGRITTLLCNEYQLGEKVSRADLLIGAVLVAGAKTPKVVSECMVKTMQKGSVIVDVAIDQGGSVESIDRVTTHDNPCYEKFGVIHYSVANMPGAVPHTSTYALAGATLPYLIQLVNKGVQRAMVEDPGLLAGLNTYQGKITCEPVALAMNSEYAQALKLIA
ncbi:MAG TPA: alanine dehydrogenase [Firmicutes bacterium]|nr:alanine dehydrogenase [Bacillota bacterium]